MDLERIITQMKRNAQAIQVLVASCGDEQSRWKPDPDTWSVLEVMNHLVDEERRDFRARLDQVLHRPEEEWARIGPPPWVRDPTQRPADLATSLEAFLAAREDALRWLGGLDDPDWDAAIVVREEWAREPLRAGDFLASWAAHDLLHMRQIIELHWAWDARQAAPYRLDYAGPW